MSMSVIQRSLVALGSFVAAVGCGASDPSGVEPGRETGACVDDECLGDLMCLSDLCVDPEATPGSGGPDQDDGPGDEGVVPLTSVSVLVVLDNSGTMGEEQALLARALGGVAEALTKAKLDWRIGITTTDVGNPWCNNTTPEAGNLVLTSCRSRPDAFYFTGATTIDVYNETCASACPAQWSDFTTIPTSIDGVVGRASRSWVQSIDGASNLPAGLSVGDAFACLAPQGIDGCGFESPLEAMHRAIAHTELPGGDNEGFLPQGALLAVILVTDEADCSVNMEYDTIFMPDGGRVFWSDLDLPAPTSAVCWNAGVQCFGAECASADYDVMGNPVAPVDAADRAVLHPVARYAEQLDGLDGALVTVIAGAQADGSVVYELDPADDLFVRDFGVSPGCRSVGGPAVPPVRMRELAEQFALDGEQNLASICDPSYEPAFTPLFNAIVRRLR
ncbi:MAG: hypothetical protein AAGF11_36830 [Myxococcota bacterium]